MASKQENYLRMHHPSIYKGMRKGGEVKKKKYYAEGGKNTDTVPAMLTLGEVVLNAEQQEALGKLVGMKPAALFEKIGIPGFAGGGVADKKDALVQYYENGGKAEELITKYGSPHEPQTEEQWNRRIDESRFDTPIPDMQPIALATAKKHQGTMSDEAWELLQKNLLVKKHTNEPFLRSMMAGKGRYEYPVEKMDEAYKNYLLARKTEGLKPGDISRTWKPTP